MLLKYKYYAQFINRYIYSYFPLSANAQQRLFEDIQDVRSFIRKHMPRTVRECKKTHWALSLYRSPIVFRV